MWIARDDEGSLNLHIDKPSKISVYGHWRSEFHYPIPSNLLPEVTWEDEEPRELILKLYGVGSSK